MPHSVKFTSLNNSEKSLLVTYDTFWENAKFYFEGKLVRSFTAVSELQKGVQFEIEEFGRIDFRVHSITFKPTLLIIDEDGISENYRLSRNNRTNGVLIVFGLLAISNLIAVLYYAFIYYDFPGDDLSTTPLFLYGLFTAIYVISIIFLRRGLYFFYFVGLGIFTFTAVYVAYLSYLSGAPESLLFLFPRFVLIGILLYYFKRVTKYMREEKTDASLEILDEKV